MSPKYSLPLEVMIIIAECVYRECKAPGDPEHNQDIVALNHTSQLWREASLHFLYSHCHIGSRGNFAIENWTTRLSTRYGQLVKCMDIALSWNHAQWLPRREQEMIESGQGGLWEAARDGLISQLAANLPNLASITFTASHCVSNESAQCLCLQHYHRTANAFTNHRLESVYFHGVVTSFCPRLASPILVGSQDSLTSVYFGDELDGLPSVEQPIELICSFPKLRGLSLAASVVESRDLGALHWVCGLEEITIADRAEVLIPQPISSERLSALLSRFSSTLRSLVLRNTVIGGAQGDQLTVPSDLGHITIHSTRDVTFQTLERFTASRISSLSVYVTVALQATPLLNALAAGAFPKLKRLCVYLNQTWSMPVRWDTGSTSELRGVCDTRSIELIVFEGRRREPSAKVLRRRVRAA
ncbi:hypothetical protein RhiJN_23082 [Ceratobasidium sp. AG-Ba]|nr:hypothetical protein RhiJN_23082 [Ceratobasidium sp. AG-Ba]